jgi:citrate synthase
MLATAVNETQARADAPEPAHRETAMANETEVRVGLDGVVVAETRLSRVDGERGRLIVRGHDVEALARTRRFEDVAALLWTGALPDAAESWDLARELGEARVRAFARVPGLRAALSAPDGMEALRAAAASLREEPGESAHALRVRLTASLAVFAAAWARLSAGNEPVAPDATLPHAADLLRCVRAAPASAAEVSALGAYLVTVAEHGMNASTFTARVVASTGSDAISAVVAAIGALKGPLHGGAPGPVLDMLDAIGEPENAEAWLRAELDAGKRLMGLGHRVYRVRDPRAAVLERAVARLEADGGASPYLARARAVERVAVRVLAERYPSRKLDTNVEFYTAVLLDALGFARAAFSPLFAVGRVAGWLAHVDEERERGRLIRPDVRYVGATPEEFAA